MRLYAAIVTGSLAFMLCVFAAWSWTSMDVLEIAVWSVFAYYAGLASVLWVTEPKPKKQARKHTEPQIFTLK